jgi:hypothetical protein
MSSYSKWENVGAERSLKPTSKIEQSVSIPNQASGESAKSTKSPKTTNKLSIKSRICQAKLPNISQNKVVFIIAISLLLASIITGFINFNTIIYQTRELYKVGLVIIVSVMITLVICANVRDQVSIILPRHGSPVSDKEIKVQYPRVQKEKSERIQEIRDFYENIAKEQIDKLKTDKFIKHSEQEIRETYARFIHKGENEIMKVIRPSAREYAIKEWSKHIRGQSLLFLAAILGFAFLLSETMVQILSMLAQVSWVGFGIAIFGAICLASFLRNYPIPKVLIRLTEQDKSSEVKNKTLRTPLTLSLLKKEILEALPIKFVKITTRIFLSMAIFYGLYLLCTYIDVSVFSLGTILRWMIISGATISLCKSLFAKKYTKRLNKRITLKVLRSKTAFAQWFHQGGKAQIVAFSLIIFANITPICVEIFGDQWLKSSEVDPRIIWKNKISASGGGELDVNGDPSYFYWADANGITGTGGIWEDGPDAWGTQFSAMGDCYVIANSTCEVPINFSISYDSGDIMTTYSVAKGFNAFPLSFFIVPFNYTLEVPIGYADYFVGFSICPAILAVGEANFTYCLDGSINESPIGSSGDVYEIPFYAYGSVAILLDLEEGFELNQLWVKIDDYMLQSLHPFTGDGREYLGIPAVPIEVVTENLGLNGLCYNINLDEVYACGTSNPGKHVLKIAADISQYLNGSQSYDENCSIIYKILACPEGDFDQDGLSNYIETNVLDNTIGMFWPDTWGYFTIVPEVGMSSLLGNWSQGEFQFTLRDKSGNYLYIDYQDTSEYRNFTIDGTPINIAEVKQMGYTQWSIRTANFIFPGVHTIGFEYNTSSSNPKGDILFTINDHEILINEQMETDSSKLSTKLKDSDGDSVPDTVDLSKNDYMLFDSDLSQQIVMPVDLNTNTEITIQLSKPELDLYEKTHVDGLYQEWNNEVVIEAIPVIRLMGNLTSQLVYDRIAYNMRLDELSNNDTANFWNYLYAYYSIQYGGGAAAYADDYLYTPYASYSPFSNKAQMETVWDTEFETFSYYDNYFEIDGTGDALVVDWSELNEKYGEQDWDSFEWISPFNFWRNECGELLDIVPDGNEVYSMSLTDQIYYEGGSQGFPIPEYRFNGGELQSTGYIVGNPTPPAESDIDSVVSPKWDMLQESFAERESEILYPEVSEDCYTYTIKVPANHTSKRDGVLDLRFTVLWEIRDVGMMSAQEHEVNFEYYDYEGNYGGLQSGNSMYNISDVYAVDDEANTITIRTRVINAYNVPNGEWNYWYGDGLVDTTYDTYNLDDYTGFVVPLKEESTDCIESNYYTYQHEKDKINDGLYFGYFEDEWWDIHGYEGNFTFAEDMSGDHCGVHVHDYADWRSFLEFLDYMDTNNLEYFAYNGTIDLYVNDTLEFPEEIFGFEWKSPLYYSDTGDDLHNLIGYILPPGSRFTQQSDQKKIMHYYPWDEEIVCASITKKEYEPFVTYALCAPQNYAQHAILEATVRNELLWKNASGMLNDYGINITEVFYGTGTKGFKQADSFDLWSAVVKDFEEEQLIGCDMVSYYDNCSNLNGWMHSPTTSESILNNASIRLNGAGGSNRNESYVWRQFLDKTSSPTQVIEGTTGFVISLSKMESGNNSGTVFTLYGGVNQQYTILTLDWSNTTGWHFHHHNGYTNLGNFNPDNTVFRFDFNCTLNKFQVVMDGIPFSDGETFDFIDTFPSGTGASGINFTTLPGWELIIEECNYPKWGQAGKDIQVLYVSDNQFQFTDVAHEVYMNNWNESHQYDYFGEFFNYEGFEFFYDYRTKDLYYGEYDDNYYLNDHFNEIPNGTAINGLSNWSAYGDVSVGIRSWLMYNGLIFNGTSNATRSWYSDRDIGVLEFDVTLSDDLGQTRFYIGDGSEPDFSIITSDGN